MALLVNTNRRMKGLVPESRSMIVANTLVPYKGSLMALDRASGHVRPHNDAAGYQFIGLFNNPTVTGDGAARHPVLTGSYILESVTVTGSAAATDNFSPVFATDDDVLTLTRPATNAQPVGYVQRWISGTTCDVVLLDATTAWAMAMLGGTRRILPLGQVVLANISGAADVKTGIPLYGRGNIVGFYAVVVTVTSDTDGSIDLNLEIDTTNLTGGVLQLRGTQITTTDLDTLGARITSTAITAANTFSDGQTISVESASVTAFSNGVIDLFVEIDGQPGA